MMRSFSGKVSSATIIYRIFLLDSISLGAAIPNRFSYDDSALDRGKSLKTPPSDIRPLQPTSMKINL